MTRNKETVSLAAPIGNKSPFYKACSGWECQNLKLTLNLHFLSHLLKIIRCCNGGLRAKLFLGSLKHEIKKATAVTSFIKKILQKGISGFGAQCCELSSPVNKLAMNPAALTENVEFD